MVCHFPRYRNTKKKRLMYDNDVMSLHHCQNQWMAETFHSEVKKSVLKAIQILSNSLTSDDDILAGDLLAAYDALK